MTTLLSAVALSIALASTQDAPAPADLVAVRRLINSGEPHKALEALRAIPRIRIQRAGQDRTAPWRLALSGR